MNPFYNLFADYVKGILSKYSRWQPLDLTTSIGFTGTTSERFTVYTPAVDADSLLFGANVDFSNANVTLKITDTSSGYVWNLLQGTAQGTPIVAIAGITTQATPVLPLICPFFLSRQSKLQMDFVNSASGATTGGNITWVGLKLLA